MEAQEDSTSHEALFFGGTDKQLKTVKALPHRSFRALADQMFNVAVLMNLTREEFQALPEEDRRIRKRVPYLTPCCFNTSPCHRSSEYATNCNLIFLDIDPDKESGRYVAAPYVDAPWTLVEQLMPFNFAVYHTASSMPKKPRIRVVVEADGLPPDKYRDAVLYVARLIGLVEITKESFTYVQPMYLPTIFKGEAEQDIHPLIVQCLDGRAVTLKDIKAVASTHGTGESKNQKNMKAENYTSGDVLDFLRPIVEEVTLEDAAAALAHVDPDVNYPDWLEIAAALRHQFTGVTSEDAYVIFDEWSSLGTKYAGQKDTRAKWDSLRPNPVNRVPITIRSLLHRAQESGWDGNRTMEKCFHATRQWISHMNRTATTLMTEGLGKIIATPMISQAGEEALLNMIVEECRKRFSVRVSTASLRKDLANMRLEMKEKNNKKKDISPPWTKGLCYVAATDQFFRQATGERFSPVAFDRYYSAKLMTTPEGTPMSSNSEVGAAGRPAVKPQDYLLNQIQVPKVYDYVYDPRFPSDTFLHYSNRPFVNTYVQNFPEPDKKTSKECGQLFLMHLRNLVEEEEYRNTLMDFLAYLVQFPGKKIRWACLIQGVEGCGKTFIAEAMKAVLGIGHVRTVDNNAISSAYNDWAYGSQLITFEEIRVAGHNRHDIMNVLKPLITNESINVNQRYRDSRQVDNTTNYMLFTNHHDALALTKGDRRYFVLKSRLQTKEQVADIAEGTHYFTTLFNMLKNRPGGLRHFLENWPISADFEADGHAPRTKYMLEMLNDSTNEAWLFLKEFIEEGRHPLLSFDLISSTAAMEVLEASDEYRGRPLSGKMLSAVLRDESYVRTGRARIENRTHHIWVKAGSAATKINANVEANARYKAFSQIESVDWDLLE
jgi:hypothetical protein